MAATPVGRAVLFCAILYLAAQNADAYPWYWADPAASGRFDDTPAPCLLHPEASDIPLGPHKGLNADPNIGISVLATDGSVAQFVCPGRSYQVKVSFGSDYRHSLTTASYGTFAATTNKAPQLFYYPAAGSTMQKCTNRLISQQVQQVADTLTIPCDASGSLELKVTSAPGEVAFLRATQTLTLNTACADTSCSGATPGSTTPAPSSTPTPAPAPATTPVTTPTPSSTATPSSNPSTTSTPSVTSTQASNCQPSSLGYRCSKAVGSTIVHYTLGGSMPQNLCTQGAPTSSETSGTGMLHMAVEANTPGYVSLAFAQRASSMAPADAIVGWLDDNNTPNVDTYYISGKSLSRSDAKAWSTFKGVARSGTNQVVCFTRKLVEPAAQVSATLDPNTALNLNWATSSTRGLVEHDAEGGATLNLQTGDVSEVASKTELRIRWHGALMSAAWALLLPLGTLLPKHRWTMGPAKLLGEQMWFTLHVTCQTLGIGLMVAGAVIAWVFFDDAEEGDKLGQAHRVAGTVVFAAACAQYLSAFARPDREHRLRPLFNQLHWWCGRITVLLAWATIYLGIMLFHKSIYRAKLVQWIVPVAVSMGVLVLMDIVLTIMAISKRKPLGSRQPEPVVYYDNDTAYNGVAMSKVGRSADSDQPPGKY